MSHLDDLKFTMKFGSWILHDGQLIIYKLGRIKDYLSGEMSINEFLDFITSYPNMKLYIKFSLTKTELQSLNTQSSLIHLISSNFEDSNILGILIVYDMMSIPYVSPNPLFPTNVNDIGIVFPHTDTYDIYLIVTPYFIMGG